MAPIVITRLTPPETTKLLSLAEGHFVDLKAIEVTPAKLTRSLSAFGNAEGGELFVGVDERKRTHERSWRGFARVEDANGFLQAFEQFFPLGDECTYSFLQSPDGPGLVLKVEIRKSRAIKRASDGKVYIRRGAQNLPVESEEARTQLQRNKGITSFETELVNVDKTLITNSTPIIRFMLEVVPTAEPEAWLKKQQVIVDDKPTVAGLVLFAEEPQAALAKRCGLKIYRYKTKDDEGTRETLDFDPISVEGCAYDQIRVGVQKTAEIIESVRISTPTGLESVAYPVTALHEIITNAVIHRDYSIADDIHIQIFDNRVEVISPGTLPAHITPENILNERFARNGVIVRLINKFPNPPNKDVGEGLNTAFRAMREMKLRAPIVNQTGGNVRVILRHEPLATPEELILEFLGTHDQITNKEAREICFIGSENKMKRIFQRMIASGLIELVPGTTRYTAAYRLVKKDKRGESPTSLFGQLE
jgi:ATP-dependent DNA helicase RecG